MSLLLARLLSLVSNPLILSFPVPFLATYKETHNGFYALEWFFLSSFFLFMVLAFVLWGRKRGFFTDIEITKREERPLFYLFLGVISVLYLFTVILLHGPKMLLILLAGAAIGLFLFSIVNMKLKASLHVFTICVAALALGLLNFELGIAAASVVPFIIWSRIKTKHHTLPETIAGAVLGLIVTMVLFTIYRRFNL